MKFFKLVIISFIIGLVVGLVFNIINLTHYTESNVIRVNGLLGSLGSQNHWKFVGFMDELKNLPDQKNLLVDLYEKNFNPNKPGSFEQWKLLNTLKDDQEYYPSDYYDKIDFFSKDSQLVAKGFPYIYKVEIIGLKCCIESRILYSNSIIILNIFIFILLFIFLPILFILIKKRSTRLNKINKTINMENDIKGYINKMRVAGKSDDEIKDELLKVGWKEEDINMEEQKQPEKSNKKIKFSLAGIISLTLFLLGILNFILLMATSDDFFDLRYTAVLFALSIVSLFISGYQKNKEKNVSMLWILYMVISSSLFLFVLFIFSPSLTPMISIKYSSDDILWWVFLGSIIYIPIIIGLLFFLRNIYKKIYKICTNFNNISIKISVLKMLLFFILYFFAVLILAFIIFITDSSKNANINEYYTIKLVTIYFLTAILLTSFHFTIFLATYNAIIKKLKKEGHNKIVIEKNINIKRLIIINIIIYIIILSIVSYMNFEKQFGPSCRSNQYSLSYSMNCNLRGGDVICDDYYGAHGVCAVQPTSDFGKSCTKSSSECEGSCLRYVEESRIGHSREETFKCSEYVKIFKR